MIISGYQGIGKSTLATEDKGFIDLESSNFFVQGERPEGWYQMYCQVAENLSQQGYDVFVSSHKVVRDYLTQHSKEKLVLIFPSVGMKKTWISKLRSRYEKTKSDKDFKALANAEQFYDKSIKDLENQTGFLKIILTSEEYSLEYALSTIKCGVLSTTQTFIVNE